VGVCHGDAFWVHLIPHTLHRTTLQLLRPGDRVNLEADIIGKYVEKFLSGRGRPETGKEGLGLGALAKHGFVSS